MDHGAELYRRFLDGDNDALSDIIRSYRDGLILYIHSLTKNICIAEELAEETFVVLIVKKPRFSGKSSFKTWLYAIGRNTAVDQIRKYAKRHTIPIDEMYTLSDEKLLEQEYIREERNRIIHRSLKALHADYSQVLYLTFFEELSRDEVAAVMHRSKRQIENLLYRAKAALRTQLEKEGIEHEEL